MKILLSTPFDFAYPGGVNAHVDSLDRELQRTGHTTRILSPGAPDGTIDDDGHVCRIGHAIPIPANGSTARLTLSPYLSKYVQRFLEQEQFDVIHLNDPLTSTLHLTVLAYSTTTNVGTFHASNSSYLGYNLVYRFGRPVFAWFSSRIDYRIAVSPTAREFISHYFPGTYHLIPNGIDFDRYGPHVEPCPAVQSDQPTVLFVGRFDEPRKGFRYLLEAMVRVQQDMPNTRLLVVGPGDIPCIQRQCYRLNLKNVHFTGEIPSEALPSYYAAGDVFCAPSTGRESFGIVLLEAMAAGKPVIAGNIDGYRSVVRDGTEALLVKPCDARVLSNAILSVLREPALAQRLAIAGRERARLCSWPIIAQRVVECYQQARQSVGDDQQPSLAASSSLFSSTRRP
jgi:phosphatidyl-myo-inositol alpha-mannosyltransferase